MSPESGQDLHQRGFACAVLAEETVELALLHVDGDAIVGADGTEVLVDVAKLECHERRLDRSRPPLPEPPICSGA
jgi:hypothetical protein